MVIQTRLIRLASAAAILLSLSSGCGLLRWGEEAPPARIAQLARGGDSGPAPVRIFTGSDAESRATLEYWSTQTESIWGQIRGSHPDALTEGEIATLVRTRFLDLPGDPEKWIARIVSVKRLLGFPDMITRESVRSFMLWIRRYRIEIRGFYRMFLSEQKPQWSYADIRSITRLGAALLKRGVAPVSAEEFAELVQPLLPDDHPHMRAASLPFARLAINTFGSFCGSMVDQNNWNGQRISECIERALDHFNPLEPYFDYLIGARPMSYKTATLAASTRNLSMLTRRWFAERNRASIQLELAFDLARALQLPLPEGSLGFLQWLPRFSPLSTPDRLHPEVIAILADTLQQADLRFITAEPLFRQCPGKWSECTFEIDRLSQARRTNEAIDYYWRIRNPIYGAPVLPSNGSNIRFVLWLDELSAKIIPVFDREGDGFVQIRRGDDASEVLLLVATTMQFIDLKTFFDNVLARLAEQPIETLGVGDAVKRFKLPGLASLFTLIADILPVRDNDSDLREGGNLNFRSAATREVVKMDRMGITNALWMAYATDEIEEDYIRRGLETRIDENANRFVKRREVIRNLPTYIHAHFPRLYKACAESEHGFAATCGVVLSQIMPSVNKDALGNPNGENYDFEMDVMTLGALFFEGILSKCDRNGDGRWNSRFGDRYDELDCAFSTLKAAVDRMMDAQMISDDPTSRTALRIINSNGVLRAIGKAAISRGSMRGIALHGTVLAPFNQSGSITDLLSLVAEIMAPHRLEAARTHTLIPADPLNPGDELVYEPGYGTVR